MKKIPNDWTPCDIPSGVAAGLDISDVLSVGIGLGSLRGRPGVFGWGTAGTFFSVLLPKELAITRTVQGKRITYLKAPEHILLDTLAFAAVWPTDGAEIRQLLSMLLGKSSGTPKLKEKLRFAKAKITELRMIHELRDD